MKPKTILLALFIAMGNSAVGSEDLEILQESATAWVEAYNKGDAEAISSLFVARGEFALASGELLLGREEIKSYYSELFSMEARPQAALEAGSVRFVSDRIALEDGTIHLTSPEGGVSSHFYTAVHERQEDGGWLLASVRDEGGDESTPSEKLLSLEWLIGDWVIQTEAGDTWISFFWSDDGPYIDAKATTESPDAPSSSATMRIGWNENTETFQSWSFDADGGFNQSKWTTMNPGEFLLRTEGITASGETNVSTQILRELPGGAGFSWTKRDQVIAGELAEDRTLKAVKRPPEPSEESPSPEN